MSFWAYVLRCADGKYYTGHTEDMELRFAQHQAGTFGGDTSRRLPVELMWAEYFATREEAIAVENQVGGWSRAKKEALFRSDWATVSTYAKPPSRRVAVDQDDDLSRRDDLSRHDVSTSSTSARDNREGGSLSPSSDHLEPASSEVETRRRETSARDNRGGGGDSPHLDHPDHLEPASSLSRRAVERREMIAPQPAIVLVRPQLGENIGKAARAMLNFGLTDLRLVAPRDGWPNPDAGPAASGADSVLAQARVFDTLAQAVSDCTQVIATTVRRRDLIKPVVDPAGAAELVHGEAGQSAYVFGAERSGLDSDDVALARTVMTVPINPDFGSLNLAQAVIIAAYEWSKGIALAQPPLADLDPPAPQGDLEGLIEQANAALERIDYFRPEARRVTTLRNIRTLLTKPRWSAKEVQMMRGMLRGIERGPRQ